MHGEPGATCPGQQRYDAYRDPCIAGDEEREKSVNEKPKWVGIAPSPKVFEQLDHEETTVLAYLAWVSASKRQAFAADVASLPDRHGQPLGSREAMQITRTLANLKIASVLGMNNDRALSILIGGFQPFSARRPDRPAAVPEGRSGSDHPKARPGLPMEHSTGNLEALKTTRSTPAFVPAESKKLRDELNRIAKSSMSPVRAAIARKEILVARISLYERWLALEPNHPTLAGWLERKRKALPELERDIQQARGERRSA